MYYDIEGNEIELLKLVKIEPEWATNTIKYLKKQLAEKDDMIKLLKETIENKNESQF